MTSARKAVGRKASGRKTAGGKGATKPRAGSAVELPFAESVGYQIRATHRVLQRFLGVKIEPHGITPGMWYFLRALWHEDGLTQRELSARVGTMEPTTLSAILVMEKKGLVRRVRNPDDRRKWHIHLTPKGRGLKARLLPLAREVVDTAVQNLSRAEVAQLLKGLAEVQKSLHATLGRLDGADSETTA
ncbi:MAG TPA: MarR family transcriptional regulator [Bradyrhizobium sp.]|uniref:MarR family winged helix-turn-helix transcriptional regulator n=1 Tax=Bradyrhizobium sp. TaxID=376 RepID=UPI002D80BA01|nr:MarR family transcriptional regulator [Bradyrhizobium sp.]HET7887143.1 MarR family transcriptional regulator [Bradyrhizobium sp.]